MKKFLLSLCVLFSIANWGFAEGKGADTGNGDVAVAVDTKKHPLVAVGGMLVFNLSLASYNRWVLGSAWAQTGPDEWNRFWERQMTWDRDWYWTNYFLHPYQGSMYYMSSRGANLNVLESMAVTVLGSTMWEFLCEKNDPSKNDMVYTTIGSFCVGEMFFRLSQEANGTSRLLGAALNPERMFTEYLCGVKQQNTSGNIYSMDMGIAVGNVVAGTKLDYQSDAYKPQEIYPAFGMIFFDVDYNNPYGHDSNTPYSQFSLNVQGGMGAGSGEHGACAYENWDEKLFYDIRILSDAVLVSRSADFGENVDTTYGLGMIYDFDWHSYWMLSSLAPGVMFKQRFNKDSSSVEYQAYLAGILLGTTDYYYYHRDILAANGDKPDMLLRTYSNTIGIETLLKFKYGTESGHLVDVMFRGYAMYDFYDQLQSKTCEPTGWEYVGLLTASYELPVSKRVRIGIKDELYGKATDYRKKQFVPKDVYQLANTAKVFAKIVLK